VKDSAVPPIFHPVTSFPLNRLVNPGSTAGAFPWKNAAKAERRMHVNCMARSVAPLRPEQALLRTAHIRIPQRLRCIIWAFGGTLVKEQIK
jgi:hypothetical protein